MHALIDGDIVAYECAPAGEYLDEDGEKQIKSFDYVADVLDDRIKFILEGAEADKCTIFLTGTPNLIKQYNKIHKYNNKKPLVFIPNFRFKTAKLKPYKNTRPQEKPHHLHDIHNYLLVNYNCVIANGYEADDDMSSFQTLYNNKKIDGLTIICTRDKDLRQVPGWHYGWECNLQPEYGPTLVTELGELVMQEKVIKKGDKEIIQKKLVGTGLKYFYAQVLMGDPTDTIPGLPKCGQVAAFEALKDCENEQQLFSATSGLYQNKYGDDWRVQMKEQIDLVWMVRDIVNGHPVLHIMYDERGIV